MRETTRNKEKEVLKVFHRLLRSGKDYSTRSMYEEAGKPCFLTGGTAGNIVRKYYQKIITPEMKDCLESMNGEKHEQKINLFSDKFNLCRRESRLIIRYIKMSK